MKFILVPIGSAGDMFPFVGLGRALMQRGHDVIMLINEYFRDTVERAGVPFHVISSAAEYLQVAHDPRIWHPFHGPRTVLSFAVKLIQPVYDAILADSHPGEATIVNTCLGWGARIAQERDGYALATVDLQPAMLFSALDPPALLGLSRRAPAWWNRLVFGMGVRLVLDPVCCPSLNAWRREFGLSDVGRITDWWHSPDRILGMFPAWFAPPAPDWPAQLRLTDFPLWDDGNAVPLSDEVRTYLDDGEPPIVVTPGSANPCDRPFWDAVVSACQQLRRRAMLMARFSEQIPHPLPHGVEHFDYASFAQLLPRAAALVHHGGIGTTARGLAAGIPQVICPFSHDQPDNANRLRRLGVGDRIDRRLWTPDRLAGTLDRLLTDAGTAARCQELSNRISRIDPFAESCDVLCSVGNRQSDPA